LQLNSPNIFHISFAASLVLGLLDKISYSVATYQYNNHYTDRLDCGGVCFRVPHKVSVDVNGFDGLRGGGIYGTIPVGGGILSGL
jgi:hypothetical protein